MKSWHPAVLRSLEIEGSVGTRLVFLARETRNKKEGVLLVRVRVNTADGVSKSVHGPEASSKRKPFVWRAIRHRWRPCRTASGLANNV